MLACYFHFILIEIRLYERNFERDVYIYKNNLFILLFFHFIVLIFQIIQLYFETNTN